MVRKLQIVRLRLSDGSRGLYLHTADTASQVLSERVSDEGCQVAEPMLLECDDQISIADLLLLSEYQGQLH